MDLKLSQKMPGSVIWRLRNYGPLATVKYILFEKIFQRKELDSKSIETSSISVAEFLSLNQTQFNFVSNFIDKYLIDCETMLVKDDLKIKFGVVGKDSPKNRLYAIGLAIIALKPDLYIETGTQHGVSVGFVEKLSESLGMKLKIVSFDVNTYSEIIPGFGFERIILDNPVRKNLLKNFYELKVGFRRIIFFHDSDHSFENMYSEFQTALRALDPIAIISDDVSLNKSFSRFCKREELIFKEFTISSGNAAGIALRHIRDPDGT
jgi:hypothetical protein